ncbi:ribonuclease P [Streptococcus agalactiae]|nr:ribonuclease P [Streptococcus agalactiae]
MLRVFLITSKSLQGRLISLSHVRIFCCINMTKFINILNYLFFQNRITM